jgi:phosphoadenosine phosphosulfate reductase
VVEKQKTKLKTGISPKIERARIVYAMRNCPTRIMEPQEVVVRAIEKHGDKLAVSCSFGHCSVVVLHMALQINPNIKVVFNNTGVEYPETYAYRDLLKKEWNLNLIETKPLKSFWKCIDEYGFPLIRRKYKNKKRVYGVGTDKPKCCVFLKELPMKQACKQYRLEATLTGLRCAESSVRMFTLAQRGQYYHSSKYGELWRYHPIGFWTHRQVREYLEKNGLPINAIYKKVERSGCMPCTGFLNWETQLSKTNLKMYRIVQRMRKVDLLDNYIEFENGLADTCVQNIVLDGV